MEDKAFLPFSEKNSAVAGCQTRSAPEARAMPKGAKGQQDN
jgi:hypothetical protein